MKSEIDSLIDAVKLRNSHVLIASGNIYDEITTGSARFRDIAEWLEKMSEKKFQQFITYDLFSGIRVTRGDTPEILAQMGIKQEADNENNPDADLMRALRGAGMVRTSEFPSKPSEVFRCFDALLNTNKAPTFILIEYSQAIFAEDSITPSRESEVFNIALTKWSRDLNIRKNGHLVMLLCRDGSNLNHSILDRAYSISHIRIGKPTLEELEIFFKEQKNLKADPVVLAKISRGLALYDFPVLGNDISINSVMELKKKVLASEYGDVLTVLDSPFGFDAIGGMEKQIRELRIIAENMRTGNASAIPQGIMLVGPPGTGKTLTVQAMAKSAGVNCISPGDIKNMFVGQSEARMTRFTNALMDLAPVIVCIDEFDQNQAQRGGYDGDSGVSRKLSQKLLMIMSDTGQRGKILWVILTNRPDLIDPAFKRPGRCDIRIPFLLPNTSDLESICRAALVQYPDVKSSIDNWSKFTQKCEGFNGSDMVEVVLRSWRHARRRNLASIQNDDMDWAIKDYIPPRSDIQEIARMSLLALLECSSQSLMPDNWQVLASKYAEVLTGKVHNISDQEDARLLLSKSLVLN